MAAQPMPRPKVFIGSSTEGSRYAEAVQGELVGAAVPVRWNQPGVFRPGRSTFESLIELAREYDYGVFIFSPDDTVTIRGDEAKVPRDNVLFEFALFTGKKGPDCVFALAPKMQLYRTLTDLYGITLCYFDPPAKPASRDDYRNAVTPACLEIKTIIEEKGLNPREQTLIEEIATNVRTLLEAHTTNTRYLGEFPGFFKEHIIPMLEAAESEFHVACDFPTYGLFSAGNTHDTYVELLHQKKNSITIHGLFLNENRRKKATFDQLPKLDEWDKELKNPKFAEKTAAFRIRTGSGPFRTPDELGNKLMQMHANEIEDFKDNIARPNGTFAELDTPMPIYLWLADRRRAVFSIPHYGSAPTEHGFETANPDLVKSLKLLWERYRENVPP